MRPPSSAAPRRNRGLALLILTLLASISIGGMEARAQGEEREESEPRLFLPGGHVVRAGQWIDLRWTRADEIAELEILLSVDGGKHYTIWVSPRLDPDRCRYLWRVPALDNAGLSIRIRFNRGGREIEGAPTPLLLAPDHDQPEPLALPPLGDGDAERAPRSGGRGEMPQRPGVGPSEATDEASYSHHASMQATRPVTPGSLHRPTGTALHTTLTAPRFVPLRT